MTITGVDSDVLVQWAMVGGVHHSEARALVANEVSVLGNRLGLVPQVLHETLHVVTDPRRFARPMPMENALRLVGELWDAAEVVRVLPRATALHRTLELMRLYRLGRQRILDTALAATLEVAGVTRLLTFNRSDFAVFSFLELVQP